MDIIEELVLGLGLGLGLGSGLRLDGGEILSNFALKSGVFRSGIVRKERLILLV